MRICKNCGKSQPLDLFIRNRRSRDGLAHACTPCREETARDRRIAKREAGYEIRPEHHCLVCDQVKAPEAFTTSGRTKTGQGKLCKECTKGKTRQWIASRGPVYADIQERVFAYCKSAYAKDPEKFKKRKAAWVAANPHKKTAQDAKRRAAKLLRTPRWLSKLQLAEIAEMYWLARAISQITGVPHQVDHIVPLCGATVSGLHVPWNLQILSASENMKKRNKF